jgi:hypothetical protein
MDDIKACGSIFQPAVMPTKGWTGLTADNNPQALSIATIMEKFTDEGIEVWLRFAHEVNWYQCKWTRLRSNCSLARAELGLFFRSGWNLPRRRRRLQGGMGCRSSSCSR